MLNEEELRYFFDSQQYALASEVDGIKQYIEKNKSNIEQLQKSLNSKMRLFLSGSDAEHWNAMEEFFYNS
jgi:hypothetical protein